MKKQIKPSKNIGMTAFLKFVALVIPLVLYLLVILLVFPAPNSGFLTLGILGSITIGFGLINIVGLIDDMYMGHAVTAILLSVGALLITISSIIMYTPTIYSGMNENYVSFYFIVWSLLIVSGIYYPFFRHAISLNLQRTGISKTSIKEKLKGAKNYWWYGELKQQIPYRLFWSTNKVFTVLFPCTSLVHLLVGWYSKVSLFILLALSALLMMNFVMGLAIVSTWNLAHNDRASKSSLTILGVCIFPITAIIGLVIYFVKYVQ